MSKPSCGLQRPVIKWPGRHRSHPCRHGRPARPLEENGLQPLRAPASPGSATVTMSAPVSSTARQVRIHPRLSAAAALSPSDDGNVDIARSLQGARRSSTKRRRSCRRELIRDCDSSSPMGDHEAELPPEALETFAVYRRPDAGLPLAVRISFIACQPTAREVMLEIIDGPPQSLGLGPGRESPPTPAEGRSDARARY